MNCAICLRDQLENESFVIPCYHSFCLECIQGWLQHGTTCPLCKRNIDRLVFDVKNQKDYQIINLVGETKLLIPKHPKRAQIYENDLSVIQNKTIHNVVISLNTFRQKRVEQFIKRDLETILKSYHVETLTEFVITLFEKYDMKSDEVKKALKEYLGDHTDKFIEEVYFFCKTKLTVQQYDEIVKYAINISDQRCDLE